MTAKRLYEGMFLVDSALATADWDGTLAMIENILKRAEAEVVAIRKWGERKLAYDIERKQRGTYILAYFKADGRRISGIEKDVQLSEKVMRCLVLGTEKRPPELIEADIKGLPKDDVPIEAAPDRDDAEGRGDRRPRRSLSDVPGLGDFDDGGRGAGYRDR
ncbi:MAG TPA: 30S ribosomal protein S6 [Sedimentisphaerales bacterium]|nr:30S ribosomal protein S6 [Sedimentisphaerales bacterium]